MVLNLKQQKAVENGEPVAVNVAGTECVLLRRDVYLRLDPDYETGKWTIEEMNMLADEAEALISQKELNET
jgi:propanediol utilization protein